MLCAALWRKRILRKNATNAYTQNALLITHMSLAMNAAQYALMAIGALLAVCGLKAKKKRTSIKRMVIFRPIRTRGGTYEKNYFDCLGCLLLHSCLYRDVFTIKKVP